MNLIENYWFEIIVAFFIWNGAIILASILYRKRKRDGQTPFDDSTLEFYEGWVSGHSGKNFFTRLGGASRCLKVSVNNQEVYVRPFAVFALGFLSEILDLEQRISRDRILSVTEPTKMIGENAVCVTYSDANGQERSFYLYLKKKSEFISLLQQRISAT